MYSILFLCTANRFRSPIAETAFRQLLIEEKIENEWKVESAGTWTQAGFPVIPSDQWIRDNLGLEIFEHRSKSVDLKSIPEFDLIIVMEANQKEALIVECPGESYKMFLLTELVDGPVYDIPDPVLQKNENFLSIGNEIIYLIKRSYVKILELTRLNHEMKN